MPVMEDVPKIRARGTVRVSLPAKAAYNPDLLKQSIGSLLERLGCPKCFSGADCFFTHERDFLIDAKNGISAVALNPQPLPPEPPPDKAMAVVSLAPGNRYDIAKIFKAVDKVIDIIGECPCHSGIDVLYQNELKVIGVDAKGEAHQFGG
jgi:hypothetical protein